MNFDGYMMLPDGRNLGFQTIGDNKNPAFIFFHGTPGSRLYFSASDKFPSALKDFFLILPERPGYGHSTNIKSNTFNSWIQDVLELANQLSIEKFFLGGESAGAAYALAGAFFAPPRINKLILLSAPSPITNDIYKSLSNKNKLRLILNKYCPGLVRFLLNRNRKKWISDNSLFLKAMKKELSREDAALFDDPGFQQTAINDIKEAYAKGVHGQFNDLQLLMQKKPWEFDLNKIAVPVHLWYGKEDTIVPVSMRAYLSAMLPVSSVKYIDNAGHFLSENDRVLEDITRILST